MGVERPETRTVYQVYCRECDWSVPEPVALKGEANVRAGRHISQTGHVVTLKSVETPVEEGDDFRRGGRRVEFEALGPDAGLLVDHLPA